MANGENGLQLGWEVLRTIAVDYGWPVFAPIERTIAKIDPATLDSFVGVYRYSPDVSCAITRESDRLFSQQTGGPKEEVFPMSARGFFVTSIDFEYEFAPDIGGKSPEMIVRHGADVARLKRVNDGASH